MADRYGGYGRAMLRAAAPSSYEQSDSERMFAAADRAGISRSEMMQRIKTANNMGGQFGNVGLATRFAIATADLNSTDFMGQLGKTAGHADLTNFAGELQMSYGTMNADSEDYLHELQKKWDRLNDNERSILRAGYRLQAPDEVWERFAEEKGLNEEEGGGIFRTILSAVDTGWDYTAGAVLHEAADWAGDVLHYAAEPQKMMTRGERTLYMWGRGGYDLGEAWTEAGRGGGESAYRKDTYKKLDKILEDLPVFRSDLQPDERRLLGRRFIIEIASEPGDNREMPEVIDYVVRKVYDLDQDADPGAFNADPKYREAFNYLYQLSDNGVVEEGTDLLFANKTSPGRQIGNLLFSGDRKNPFYNLVSGLTDAAWTFASDPLLLGGKAYGVYRAGRFAVKGSEFAATLERSLGDETFLRGYEATRAERTFGDFGQFADKAYRRNYLNEVNRIAKGNRQLALATVLTDAFNVDKMTTERYAQLYRFMNASRGSRGVHALQELVNYDLRLRGVHLENLTDDAIRATTTAEAKPLQFVETGKSKIDKLGERMVDIHTEMVKAAKTADRITPPSPGKGLRTIEDFKQFFKQEEGMADLLAGAWGDYGRGYTELPYLSRSGIQKTLAKLSAEDWLDNWRGGVLSITEGLNGDDFLSAARAPMVIARAKRKIGNSIQKAITHVPRSTAISVSTSEGADDFRRFLTLGLDNQTTAHFMGALLAAPTGKFGGQAISVAARRGIIFRGMAASLRGIGVAPETVGDIIAGYGAYQKFYSIKGNDIIEGMTVFGKPMRSALFSTQLAHDKIFLPPYAEVLRSAENLTKYQSIMDAVIRSERLDRFMGKWRTAILMTPRFAFRTAGEEALAWVARNGFMSPLKYTFADPARRATAHAGELPWYLHPFGMAERELRHLHWRRDFQELIKKEALDNGISLTSAARMVRRKQQGVFNPEDIRLTKHLSNGVARILNYKAHILHAATGRDFNDVFFQSGILADRYGPTIEAHWEAIGGTQHQIYNPTEAHEGAIAIVDATSGKPVFMRPVGHKMKRYITDDGAVMDPALYHVLTLNGSKDALDHTASGMHAALHHAVDETTALNVGMKLNVEKPFDTIETFRRVVSKNRAFEEKMWEIRRAHLEDGDPLLDKMLGEARELLNRRKALTPEIDVVLSNYSKLDSGEQAMLLSNENVLWDDLGGRGVPIPRTIRVNQPELVSPTEGSRALVREIDEVEFDLADPEWRAAIDDFLPAREDGTVRLWQMGPVRDRWYSEIDNAEMRAASVTGSTDLRFVDVTEDEFRSMADAAGNLNGNQIRQLRREWKTIPFNPIDRQAWIRREDLIRRASHGDMDAANELALEIGRARRMSPTEAITHSSMDRHMYDTATGDGIIGPPHPATVRVLVPMLPEDAAHQAVVRAFSQGNLSPEDTDILATWLIHHGYSPEDIDPYIEAVLSNRVTALPDLFVPLGGIGTVNHAEAIELAERWAEQATLAMGRRYKPHVGYIDVERATLSNRAKMAGDRESWVRLHNLPEDAADETRKVELVPDIFEVSVARRRDVQPVADPAFREMSIPEFLDSLGSDALLDDELIGAIDTARELIAGGKLQLTTEGEAFLGELEDLTSNLATLGARVMRDGPTPEVVRLQEEYYRRVYELLDGKPVRTVERAGIYHMEDAAIGWLPTRVFDDQVDDPIVRKLRETFGDDWHLIGPNGIPRQMSSEELERYKAVALDAYEEVVAKKKELQQSLLEYRAAVEAENTRYYGELAADSALGTELADLEVELAQVIEQRRRGAAYLKLIDDSAQSPSRRIVASTFEYKGNALPGWEHETTIDAVRAGDRTSTTRWGKGATEVKSLRPGDVFYFHGKDAEDRVRVVVTGRRTIDFEKMSPEEQTKFLDAWSKREGWSPEYGRSMFMKRGGRAEIVEFALADDPDEIVIMRQRIESESEILATMRDHRNATASSLAGTSHLDEQIAAQEAKLARMQSFYEAKTAGTQWEAYGDLPTEAVKTFRVTTKNLPGGGKGTAVGDAKDVAMREIADSAIVEIGEVGAKSSTATTKGALPKPGDESRVVMLARQNTSRHRRYDLRDETKRMIKAAHDRGAVFVVGDMPLIDEPYVRYLDSIGAEYTVFHTGETPRLQLTKRTKTTALQNVVATPSAGVPDWKSRRPNSFLHEGKRVASEKIADLLDEMYELHDPAVLTEFQFGKNSPEHLAAKKKLTAARGRFSKELKKEFGDIEDIRQLREGWEQKWYVARRQFEESENVGAAVTADVATPAAAAFEEPRGFFQEVEVAGGPVVNKYLPDEVADALDNLIEKEHAHNLALHEFSQDADDVKMKEATRALTNARSRLTRAVKREFPNIKATREEWIQSWRLYTEKIGRHTTESVEQARQAAFAASEDAVPAARGIGAVQNPRVNVARVRAQQKLDDLKTEATRLRGEIEGRQRRMEQILESDGKSPLAPQRRDIPPPEFPEDWVPPAQLRARLAAIESVRPAKFPDPAELAERVNQAPYYTRQTWVDPEARWVRPEHRAAGPEVEEIPPIGPHPSGEWTDPHADIRNIDYKVQEAATKKYGPHWRTFVPDADRYFELPEGAPGMFERGKLPVAADPNEKVIVIGKSFNGAAEDAVNAAYKESYARATFRDGRINYAYTGPVAKGEFTRSDAELLNIGDMRKGWFGPEYEVDKRGFWYAVQNGFFNQYAGPVLRSMVRNPMMMETVNKHLPEIASAMMPVLRDPDALPALRRVLDELGMPDTEIDELFVSLDKMHNRAYRDKMLSTEAFAKGTDPDLPAVDPIASRNFDLGDDPHPAIEAVFKPVREAQAEYKTAFLAAKRDETIAARDATRAAAKRVHERISEADQQLGTISHFWHNEDKAWERVTEVAYRRAYNELLPFIDDHHIKSMAAVELRNMFPFWYAEEQFLKRWMRALKRNPAAIRRVQLLHQGLRSTGFIQKDENGNEMYVIPMGGEFVNAFSHLGPFSWIFGSGPKHGVGVDFLGNVNYSLPGVGSDRVGIPNPSFLVSVPLTFVQGILPEMAPINRAILGDRTASKGIVEQIIPHPWMSIYEAIVKDPANASELAGTVAGAMAQLDAAGLTPPPDANDDEINTYVDRVTNWTRIMNLTKSLFGLFTLSTPSEEIQDSLSPEFKSLMTYAGDYEEALNLFIQKYPDATPYTVFGTKSISGATIPPSVQATQWLVANGQSVKEAPMGMPWLLPWDIRRQVGEYDGIAFQQQMQFGLRDAKMPKEFLRELQLARSQRLYFKEKSKYDMQIMMAKTPEARDDLRDIWRMRKEQIFLQNPLLQPHIEGNEGKTRRDQTLQQVWDLVRPDGVYGSVEEYQPFRALLKAFTEWEAYNQFDEAPTDRAQEAKQQYARDVWMTLNQYSLKYPQVREFWLRIVSPRFEITDAERALLIGESTDDWEKFRDLVESE